MNIATPHSTLALSTSAPPLVWDDIDVEALQMPGRYAPALSNLDMPPAVARAVNGLSSTFGVPRAFMLVALIVATLGLVGSRMVIRIGAHVEAAVAFGLLVGASGSRKTSAARVAVDIIEDIDAKERLAHRGWRAGASDLAVQFHLDAHLKAFKKRVQDNVDAGNDEIIPIPDYLAKHAEGRQPEPTLIETRVTAAALLDALAESLSGVFLWFDEVAPLFSRGGGSELRANLLRSFDAKALTDRTRARGSRKIKTSAASLLSTIQPVMIPKLNLSQADGLFARFFFACPDPSDIAAPGLPPVDLAKLFNEVRSATLPAEAVISETIAQEVDRRATRWKAISKDAGPLMEGAYLRAPGLAVRLALAFHVICDIRPNKALSPNVNDANVRRGFDLMDKLFLPAAQIVAQEIKPNDELNAARFLARRIAELGEDMFVIRAMRRSICGPCTNPKLMAAAVRILTEANILHPFVLRPTGRGRPSPACFVNPEFLKNADFYLAEIDRPS